MTNSFPCSKFILQVHAYCGSCPQTSDYSISIETDGTMGLLGQANILSWEFGIRGTSSSAESAAGASDALVSSAMPGVEVSWNPGATLYADADGSLYTTGDTSISLTNRYSEGDLFYDRNINIGSSQITSSVFQFNTNIFVNDSFGLITDSWSSYTDPFKLGVAAPLPPSSTLSLLSFVSNPATDPLQPVLASGDPNANVLPNPLPGGAALILLAFGLIVPIANRRRAASSG